jgi:pimeloyl-ACP methyl ester carboxylesterase
MPVAIRTIETSHGPIAVSETAGKGPVAVLIHGNSSCKEVFRHQMESPLGKKYHFIAIDLPGHGASGDAIKPERSYSMPGYAEAVIETLGILGVDRAVVIGWSLGGHVAMEMLPRFDGLMGMMLMAAPPVTPTPELIQAGFKPNPLVGLLGKPELSEEEVGQLAEACYGKNVDAALLKAMRRTDGRSRALMFQGLFTGQVSDQRALAINSEVPVAMVNGADDPFVNTDYVGSLPYKSLWESHCFVLRGAGHAAFLKADAFNPILARFIDSVAAMARPSRRQASKALAS